MKKLLFLLFFMLTSINHANAENIAKEMRQFYNDNCIKYCGEGYFYDKNGNKLGGEEKVCTKYPLKCGYGCTRGWNIRYW